MSRRHTHRHRSSIQENFPPPGVSLVADGDTIAQGRMIEEEPEELSKQLGFENYPVDHEMHGPKHVITESVMNFRKNPNKDAEIIRTVNKHERFLVIDRLKDWVHVASINNPNETGFLKSEFVKDD